MRQQYYRVPKYPDVENMVKKTKEYSGILTDSKVLIHLARFGYKFIFNKFK